MIDDFGDTGGDWTADWRRLHLRLAEISRLQVDVQLQLLKERTLKLDKEETARDLQGLQDALVKLERDASIYARAVEDLRKEIATFIGAVHTYRSTWTPPEPPPSEWAVETGIDDEVVDRMARFYGLERHRPRP